MIVLAPLWYFYLQPKAVFRRARGRIYVAFGEYPGAIVVLGLQFEAGF